MEVHAVMREMREMGGCCPDVPAPGTARPGPGVCDPAGEGELALLCKALGHPVRVRIVDLLAREGRCICGDIVGVLPLAQSTVSQHLKILKQAGLVRGEIEGPRTCYCLNETRLERFGRLAAALAGRPGEDA